MQGKENLIPMNKRTKEEQSEIARMGGIASGKARRRKSNIKKTLEAVLNLDVPDDELQAKMEELGLDPSVENSLVFSVIYRTIQEGDPKALEVIARVLGQDVTAAAKREQKARIRRLKLEAEKLKHDLAIKTGEAGRDEAEAQTVAIADLINNPLEDRDISDFLYGEEGEDD